jgi:hypothetical protein
VAYAVFSGAGGKAFCSFDACPRAWYFWHFGQEKLLSYPAMALLLAGGFNGYLFWLKCRLFAGFSLGSLRNRNYLGCYDYGAF